MAVDFSGLTAEVDRATTVDASAIALLNGIKDRIDAAIAADDAGDTTALATLSSSLGSQTQALADAVANNTPAAP